MFVVSRHLFKPRLLQMKSAFRANQRAFSRHSFFLLTPRTRLHQTNLGKHATRQLSSAPFRRQVQHTTYFQNAPQPGNQINPPKQSRRRFRFIIGFVLGFLSYWGLNKASSVWWGLELLRINTEIKELSGKKKGAAPTLSAEQQEDYYDAVMQKITDADKVMSNLARSDHATKILRGTVEVINILLYDMLVASPSKRILIDDKILKRHPIALNHSQLVRNPQIDFSDAVAVRVLDREGKTRVIVVATRIVDRERGFLIDGLSMPGMENALQPWLESVLNDKSLKDGAASKDGVSIVLISLTSFMNANGKSKTWLRFTPFEGANFGFTPSHLVDVLRERIANNDPSKSLVSGNANKAKAESARLATDED